MCIIGGLEKRLRRGYITYGEELSTRNNTYIHTLLPLTQRGFSEAIQSR